VEAPTIAVLVSYQSVIYLTKNTRKIYAILDALITGGLFVTIGSLAGHADAALSIN
jgi:hypothetical protein